ncbi:ABC transporter permease [Virgibacillus doumboii]|uniref:ABC transporter permease n=1 Tax=Virgibacillus doumboii TaxID=2697503 RepID=UPI0013DEC1B0|nr:ABC transporter permease [Virgibacillus doumboii]
MIGIFLAKIKMFIRNPWTFLAMVIMSVVFAFALGGSEGYTTVNVPVYAADETVRDSSIGEMLDEADGYTFNWFSEEEMMNQIANGKADVGVKLLENDFKVIVGVSSQHTKMVQQTVKEAYIKKVQRNQIFNEANATSASEKEKIQDDLEASLNVPVFSLESTSFRGSNGVILDSTFHSLFGFTLFFVIYTIAYNVFYILTEKTDGIWDRVILSPVRKWEMYVANFVYTFITGYLQVAIVFLVFRYLVGVDFHGRFAESLLMIIPYVFAIVALSILITGLVKTVQQFNAVIPIVAVSMAMIGGAYWPIEIVESEFMLLLAKFVPITYGMEVLNGIAVYGYPIGDLLYPISILLLMGVMMTGVGIHLMEKRHV